MDDVRFGLVGCGRVAPRHAAAIRVLPGARLVAVCDVIHSRAQRFAAEYGADAHFDYADLLARPDVDAVTICTPSGLHAGMGIAAAQAGKHVLVEKPIALNLPDADALIAAAQAAGVRLGVVIQNRYNPPMQALHEAVHEGRLGRLYLGVATVRWFRPQAYYEDGWHGTHAMDGGALMNQSIHHIDALLWLMDRPVESVFAYTATLAHQMEAEDAGVAVVRFQDGALGSIEGSTLTWPENLEGSIAIFGAHGSAKVGGTALNRRVLWKFQGALEQERLILAQEGLDPPSVYGYGHRQVIADMVAAIRDGRPPQTDGHQGRRSLALVTAIYESARTSQPVTSAGA